MDANGNIIPIVEGDQGEGFKDEIDPMEILEKQTEEEAIKSKDSEKDKFEELVKKELKPQPLPSQLMSRMRMQKGMRIHFYGYSYKVTAVRPNGKITLRFDGLWKGGKGK